MKTTETPISFRIPQEMKEFLEAYAQEHDLSVSQVIRQALRKFIREASDE